MSTTTGTTSSRTSSRRSSSSPGPCSRRSAPDEPVVLLIDEVDRVEVETEALLLEILSDFQVSIPELGTMEANTQPMVVLTSNNTRELSEALKRRCLFLHIDYPDAAAGTGDPQAHGSPVYPSIWRARWPRWLARSGASTSRRRRRCRRPSIGRGLCSPSPSRTSTRQSSVTLCMSCSSIRPTSRRPPRSSTSSPHP